MKSIYLFTIGLCFAVSGFAQQHNPNDQLRSLNWDIIGGVKFELTDKNELFPIFTETIKRFDHKPFELTGYLIPIKTGAKQQRFLLATLPINQCFFCGQNGIPIMIMVEMEKAIPYSEKPIRITGTLVIEKKDASYAPPITIKNARIIG